MFLQNAEYVWKKVEFDAVNPAKTDFLLGKKSNQQLPDLNID